MLPRPSCGCQQLELLLLHVHPGRLEVSHVWLSIPFTCIYIASLAGNCTILFATRTDPSPHEPMYQFLSLMAITLLVSSLSTMPTVMSVFWVNYRENSFRECFALLYFVHFLSFVESSVLLAMAFDCYVTIWYLQRYSSILSSARIGRIGLAALRGYLLGGLPSLFLVRRLPFCQSHVLSHAFCLHQDLIKLVCADIIFNSVYRLAVVILIVLLNPLLIALSYIVICKTIVSIASQREHLKALNNCLCHILAVLILYIPMGGLSMVYHFSKHASPLIRVLLANIYLLVPPALNPIIYSI
ncbi:O51Q1 protein, partial [Grus americana]|nr:O51Q1 protein [Grus americana]